MSGQFSSPLVCPGSRAAAAERLSPLCLGRSRDSFVWLNDFPPQPQCHYALLEGAADEKRESALPPGPGSPQTHSRACWEPVAMTASGDREGAERRKEATEWTQTCGAAKWQFSAGKEDFNHMFHSHTEVSSSILGHPHSSCAKIPKIDTL